MLQLELKAIFLASHPLLTEYTETLSTHKSGQAGLFVLFVVSGVVMLLDLGAGRYLAMACCKVPWWNVVSNGGQDHESHAGS